MAEAKLPSILATGYCIASTAAGCAKHLTIAVEIATAFSRVLSPPSGWRTENAYVYKTREIASSSPCIDPTSRISAPLGAVETDLHSDRTSPNVCQRSPSNFISLYCLIGE
jgi:hypothetical protein